MSESADHILARSRMENRRHDPAWAAAGEEGPGTAAELAPHLAQARATVDSAKLTSSNRLRLPKSLFLRFLRFYTDRQTAFNRSVLQAIAAVGDSLARLSRRLSEVDDVARRADRRAHEIEAETRRLHEELRHVRFVAASLERKLETAGGTGSPPEAESEDWEARGLHGGRFARLYGRFQDEFRGTAEDIRARVAAYVPRVVEQIAELSSLEFLDVGCGRGELVRALREEGVPAVGIEANPDLATEARRAGAPVRENDLFDELSGREDASLSGVSAIQVVEHLGVEELLRFLELARAKIAPGGALVLETIDVSSLYAMRWYLADPTHRLPLMPETLSFYVRASGFDDVSCVPLHPVDESVAGSGPPDPLRSTVFGTQDFALFARRPAAAAPAAAGSGSGRAGSGNP